MCDRRKSGRPGPPKTCLTVEDNPIGFTSQRKTWTKKQEAEKVTVGLNRDETVVMLKGVPAEVCENCGEYFILDRLNIRRIIMSSIPNPKGTGIHPEK